MQLGFRGEVRGCAWGLGWGNSDRTGRPHNAPSAAVLGGLLRAKAEAFTKLGMDYQNPGSGHLVRLSVSAYGQVIGPYLQQMWVFFFFLIF